MTRSSGPAAVSAFYRTEALRIAGGFDLFLVSYYEDIDLAFRLRWAGYRSVFAPASRILHEISATNDHRSPELQRRIARNAELVFWSNLPLQMLVLASMPHLVFIAAQAAWRLARGRSARSSPANWTRSVPGVRFANAASGIGDCASAVRPPHFAIPRARSRTSAII